MKDPITTADLLTPAEQMVALRAMLRAAIANGWADIASAVSDRILDLRRGP